MSLPAGTILDPYVIQSPLGAGGMGAMYRARDTRLDRAVALRVLPDLFAADPERLARFEREAKTLAALNHPHIAPMKEKRACPFSLSEIAALDTARARRNRDLVDPRPVTFGLNSRGTPLAPIGTAAVHGRRW